MILIKKWKTTLTVFIVLAGIIAIYWFTTVDTSTNGSYKAVADKLKTEVTDYGAHHEGNLPVSGTNISLQNPAGTYFIIDICSLMPYASEDYAAIEGAGNDNCDTGSCQCNASSHYVWAVDSYGKIVSKCVGDKCKSSESDGYQGIWP